MVLERGRLLYYTKNLYAISCHLPLKAIIPPFFVAAACHNLFYYACIAAPRMAKNRHFKCGQPIIEYRF